MMTAAWPKPALLAAALFATLAAGATTEVPVQEGKPIISTDIIFETFEFGKDLMGMMTEKASKYPQPLMSPVFQNFEKHFQEFLLKNRAAAKAWDSMLAGFETAKAKAREVSKKGFDLMYEHCNPIAVELVNKVEIAMPEHKGAIRKSLGDVLLALVYFMTVTYVVLRITFWVLRKLFSILSYVLCCRCCKSKKGASSKNKRQKASNVTNATATERGKAAAKQPPAKDQTKAKGKK
mmetsp:Transcript_15850/g.28922  ORF Transcript_15850/g.28922 Transcript_15850/m.28922 type:complete len:236 (+) Transcript_15850:103-810(+)